MAENEYWTTTNVRHWQSVGYAVWYELPFDEICVRALENVCKDIRHVKKIIPGFSEIIKHLNDPAKVLALLGTDPGGGRSKELMLAASEYAKRNGKGEGVEFLLQSILDHGLDSSLELVRPPEELMNAMTDAYQILRDVDESVRPKIEKMARRIAHNPDSAIRKPSKAEISTSEESDDRTAEILDYPLEL